MTTTTTTKYHNDHHHNCDYYCYDDWDYYYDCYCDLASVCLSLFCDDYCYYCQYLHC